MLFVLLGGMEIGSCLCIRRKLDALGGATFRKLGGLAFLLDQPFFVVVVGGHVGTSAMMRAPLDGGARGWVLRSLANLGVPPLVGVVLVLVPSRLLTLLARFPSVLVGSRSFRKLSLKPVNLSGQSDDLRISTADSPQLPSATLLR